MHRDFFDEDNTGAIPSASLEDVFQELARWRTASKQITDAAPTTHRNCPQIVDRFGGQGSYKENVSDRCCRE